MSSQPEVSLFKDEVLDYLGNHNNVAQFVSFGPEAPIAVRFSRVQGYPPNHRFRSVDEAIAALVERAPEESVNIRSFEPAQPRSREFIYGVKNILEASRHVQRLAGSGLYTIVNETIDVNDGGVSGVAYGGLIEFAPGDTPRCVEKPGTVAFSFELGKRILRSVYGFEPELPNNPTTRTEFSIHPIARGHRRGHSIVWEQEEVPGAISHRRLTWPNLFSRHLGDKVFGLLVASTLEMPVPRTLAIGRATAPYEFGLSTGTAEWWLRTCPREQAPGLFATLHGWTDPFHLMAEEDPSGELIASVIAQEGVAPEFSGAAAVTASGELTIEGVVGAGDAFMLGTAAPTPLPEPIIDSVRALVIRAQSLLGPVRMEWVHDGERAWVLQLHVGAIASEGTQIFPGTPEVFHEFDASLGLGALRMLVAQIQGSGDGVVIRGDVGVTSHFGDVLRRARVPSLIQR